jgi:ribosomal protein L37AE/L43A
MSEPRHPELGNCPKCGSENIGCSLEFDREMGPIDNVWYCNDCKHSEYEHIGGAWVKDIAKHESEASDE